MVLSRAYPERSQQAQRLNVEEYVQQRIDRAKTQHTRLILQLAQLSKAELMQYFKS
jgi:hypothetical protein